MWIRLQVFRHQKCVSSPTPLGTSSPNTSSNTAQSNAMTPDHGKVSFTEGVDVEQASDVWREFRSTIYMFLWEKMF